MANSAETVIVLTGSAERDHVAASGGVKDFLLLATLKAPFFEEKSRAAVDIVTVIDRSGSMGDQNKMDLVKETLGFMVQQLKGDDRLSIVIYDERIETPLPLTKMNADGKVLAERVVESMQPRGSTDLCGGLLRGIDTIKQRQGDKNQVASVLLFTDGLANHGISHTEGILQAMAGLPVAPKLSQTSLPQVQRQQNVQTRAPQQSAIPPQNANANSWSGQVQQFFFGPQPGSVPPHPFAAASPPPAYAAPAPVPEVAPTPTPAPTVAIALPCSVHTFGFGSDHDTNMLKAIADAGSGTYFFLKDKDDIPDAFADCFGGLVSVVGQNINLELTPAPGATITKVLTKFKTVANPSGSQTVTIGDIQSEESRDILVQIDLAESPVTSEQELLLAALSYFNVLTSRQDETSTSIKIGRPSFVDPNSLNVSTKLDSQKNRITTANAIEAAKTLGDQNKLEEARKTIQGAMEKLKSSITKDEKFTLGLIHDLEKTLEGLQDRSSYVNYGQQQMNAAAGMHWNQRAAQKTWSPSYETSSRSYHKANFSKQ